MTKVLALAGALGNPAGLALLPGQRHGTVSVAPLIDDIEFGALIAGKAFDTNRVITEPNRRGAKIVIPQRSRRSDPLPVDAEIYDWRHLIENFFCKRKEFKRIAKRGDKTDTSCAAVIDPRSAVINARRISTAPSITVAFMLRL